MFVVRNQLRLFVNQKGAGYQACALKNILANVCVLLTKNTKRFDLV